MWHLYHDYIVEVWNKLENIYKNCKTFIANIRFVEIRFDGAIFNAYYVFVVYDYA